MELISRASVRHRTTGNGATKHDYLCTCCLNCSSIIFGGEGGIDSCCGAGAGDGVRGGGVGALGGNGGAVEA